MELGIGLGLSKQTINRGLGGAVPLGTYIDKDFTSLANLDDFTVATTSSTIQLSGGFLNMTGGDATYDNYAKIDTQDGRSCLTMLYKWVYTAQFKPQTTASTNNFGIGLRGDYSDNKSIIAFFNHAGGGNDGTVAIFTYDTGSGAATLSRSSAISYNTGDTIELVFERDDVDFTATVTNTANSQTASTTAEVTFNFGDTFFNPVRESKFCIYNYAGTQDVISSEVTSNQLKGADVLYVGDSITTGIFAGDQSNRFWKRLSTHATVEPYAGGGATAENTQNCADDFALLAPKKVVIQHGGNDNLATPAVYQAALTAIRTAFVNAGSEVIWALNTPRDAKDITPVNDYIEATYTSDTIITGTFNDLDDGGTGMTEGLDCGDGVHPGGWGHFKIYRIVAAALGYTIETLNEPTYTDLNRVVIEANNDVRKITASAWDGAAMSTAAFNYQNIKLYFTSTVPSTPTFGVGVGFSVTDTGDSITDLENGILLNNSSEIKVRNNSVQTAAIKSYQEGGLYEVEMSGTQLVVRENNVEIYRETHSETENTRIKVCIYRLGDYVVNVLHT